jgi:hypothetical protein
LPSVYCCRSGLRSPRKRSPDPLDFGVNDRRKEVATLPVAAPEIILHEGQYYMASLLPSLKGIQIARLAWVTAAEPGVNLRTGTGSSG